MNEEEKKPQALGGRGADGSDKDSDLSTGIQFITSQKAFEIAFKETLEFAQSEEAQPDKQAYDIDRPRGYTFILYPDSMNKNAFSILSDGGRFQGAISPLHNGDYFANGQKKKAHYHVILYFRSRVSEKELKKFIKFTLHGTQIQPVTNLIGLVRYLAHLDIQPDVFEGDKGKVRYSPDEIITFGGFDVETYLKATSTQKSRILNELLQLIDDRGFTALNNFVRYVYDEKPEYVFALNDTGLWCKLQMYIRSKYAVKHKDDEYNQMKEYLKIQDKQINKLIGYFEKTKEQKEV